MGDWIIFTNDGRRHKDRAKHRKFMEILMKHNPISILTSTLDEGFRKPLRYVRGWDNSKDSGIFKSSTLEEIKAHKDLSARSGVYTNFEDVKAVLKDLKEADLGIAVVITGLFDKVHEACREVGTGPHTVNMSAGSFGRLDLLPEPKVLEITTMCGHHMVSPYLVKHLISQVKRGRRTVKDAAVEMAKQCTCNFFNVDRATKLINEYLTTIK